MTEISDVTHLTTRTNNRKSALNNFRPSLITPYGSMHSASNLWPSQQGRCTESSDIFSISEANMIDESNQAKLIFKDVSYTVKNNDGERELLKAVSGAALPGELCAVMGSSGAGMIVPSLVLW